MYFIGVFSTVVLANFIVNNVGTICFHFIHFVSQMQLLINPIQKQLTNESKNEPDRFECFVGNTLIRCDTCENAIEKINGSEITVLISNKHMVCFYPPIEEFTSTYEASNVRFISVKIEIDYVEFDIKMCGPTYSFYVVGNDLNVDWVRYYFLKFKNIALPVNVEYQLTIIDDDVNFIVLNQFECIGLDRDEYNVYTYIKSELNDGEKEEEKEPDTVVDELVCMVETEEQMIIEMNEARNINHALKCILEEDEELDRIVAEYDMSNININ